jgi:mono/diheme cytochrome c family protein
MRRILISIGILLLVVIAGVASFVLLHKAAQRPASAETIQSTPDLVERGHYLVTAVTGCMDCHAQRDWSLYPAPVVGPLGGGGGCWGKDLGMPGTVCFPNITSDKTAGIGAWTDGEIMRAIREGVDREGNTIFPMMPYASYRTLSDDDTRAIVAYLRTLAPVSTPIEPSKVDFPVSFFVTMAPQPLPGPVPEHDRNDELAHGEYLTTVAGCRDCHTPVDGQHKPLANMAFAGGQEFKIPPGPVHSRNITPDPTTGIGAWTKEAFIARFRAYRDIQPVPSKGPEQGTVMPWLVHSKMSDADLSAIYAYLRTIKPIENRIQGH